jgi:hypothetical protein
MFVTSDVPVVSFSAVDPNVTDDLTPVEVFGSLLRALFLLLLWSFLLLTCLLSADVVSNISEVPAVFDIHSLLLLASVLLLASLLMLEYFF